MADDNVDKIIGAGREVAGQLQHLAEQVGPKVQVVALEAARLAAAQQLVWGGCQLLAGIACAVFVYRLVPIAKRSFDTDDFVCGPISIVALIISSFAALIFIGIGLSSVTDVFAWASLSHPELWIAKAVLKL